MSKCNVLGRLIYYLLQPVREVNLLFAATRSRRDNSVPIYKVYWSWKVTNFRKIRHNCRMLFGHMIILVCDKNHWLSSPFPSFSKNWFDKVEIIYMYFAFRASLNLSKCFWHRQNAFCLVLDVWLYEIHMSNKPYFITILKLLRFFL